MPRIEAGVKGAWSAALARSKPYRDEREESTASHFIMVFITAQHFMATCL